MSTTNQEVCRIKDFIEFHNESCRADTIVEPLKVCLELSGNDSEKAKKEAVLLYSLTYSVPTTIVIMKKLPELKKNPENFWKKYKRKLLFQSDRKYVKICDRFAKAYQDFWGNGVFEKLERTNDLEKSVNIVEKCFGFGRFSAFLFLETYGAIFNKNFVNNKLDWKNGATVTSGLFNVLGKDKEADLWDKNHKLEYAPSELDKVANSILDCVSRGKELAVLETNLCAYRKLFKGSRYLGYYSDRVLEELYYNINMFPECKNELSLLFTARELVIPEKYLGEKHGWTGIRKELKKLFINKGIWKW